MAIEQITTTATPVAGAHRGAARLRRERAAARASELAVREANEHLETALGIAGHELNGELTSVRLSLGLMQRRIHHMLGRGQGRQAHEDVDRILGTVLLAEQQVERLDRLVNDLLDASRVRAGKLAIHPEPTDLACIIRDVVQEQRQLAPARDLRLQIPGAIQVPVIADGDRIRQVVTNLLTNALKYSPPDRPVAVALAVSDGAARVQVRDEGPGLPAEEQKRIWQRFHQARDIRVRSSSGVRQGLGLGLYICRAIIELHRGQIGIESAPGRGSTLWFILPLARCRDMAGMRDNVFTCARQGRASEAA
jgi:signal transduction histidine kinase